MDIRDFTSFVKLTLKISQFLSKHTYITIFFINNVNIDTFFNTKELKQYYFYIAFMTQMQILTILENILFPW